MLNVVCLDCPVHSENWLNIKIRGEILTAHILHLDALLVGLRFLARYAYLTLAWNKHIVGLNAVLPSWATSVRIRCEV